MAISLYISIYCSTVSDWAETAEPIKNKKNGIYAFVIEGVFEVQDRLLHTKDGLAMWDAEEIDFEALSNGAILLLLEIPL